MSDFTIKRCSICGEEKTFSEFPSNPNYKDGIMTWCKKCHYEKILDARRLKLRIGEKDTIDVLRSVGIFAVPGKQTAFRWADVVAWGCVRIEVKTAILRPQGYFAFNFENQRNQERLHSDLVILIPITEDGQTYHIVDAVDPVFYKNGVIAYSTYYRPHRLSAYNGRDMLTPEKMIAAQNAWHLIEEKRLEIQKLLLSGEYKDNPGEMNKYLRSDR